MKKLIRNVEEIAHTNRYSRTDDIKVHIKAETGPKLTLTFGQLAKYIPLFSRRTPHEDLIFSIIDGYTNKFTVEFIHRWILQQSKNKGWQQWKDDAALTTEEQFFSAYRFASNGTAPEMYHDTADHELAHPATPHVHQREREVFAPEGSPIIATSSCTIGYESFIIVTGLQIN